MSERFKARMTFANVMSVVAVFIALGGASYAALSKNSVGAKQIKKNAIRSAEIRNGAVTAGKVAVGAVAEASLDPGLLAKLTDRCPAGMTQIGNAVCFDNADRTAAGVTFGEALNTCTSAGLRLPSISEIYLAFGANLLNSPGNYVWVESLQSVDDNLTVERGLSFDSGGGFAADQLTFINDLRCVTTPGDG